MEVLNNGDCSRQYLFSNYGQNSKKQLENKLQKLLGLESSLAHQIVNKIDELSDNKQAIIDIRVILQIVSDNPELKTEAFSALQHILYDPKNELGLNDKIVQVLQFYVDNSDCAINLNDLLQANSDDLSQSVLNKKINTEALIKVLPVIEDVLKVEFPEILECLHSMINEKSITNQKLIQNKLLTYLGDKARHVQGGHVNISNDEYSETFLSKDRMSMSDIYLLLRGLVLIVIALQNLAGLVMKNSADISDNLRLFQRFGDTLKDCYDGSVAYSNSVYTIIHNNPDKFKDFYSFLGITDPGFFNQADTSSDPCANSKSFNILLQQKVSALAQNILRLSPGSESLPSFTMWYNRIALDPDEKIRNQWFANCDKNCGNLATKLSTINSQDKSMYENSSQVTQQTKGMLASFTTQYKESISR